MTPFLPSFEGCALRSILSAASRSYNEPNCFCVHFIPLKSNYFYISFIFFIYNINLLF
ncbi:hypothetical protein BAXH7_04042 [Bacillus amyloliquefaciens XH7]|nr:hypothetical protein LL3_04047 [Bacillus amyloliquefaciens LL3]AEK91150.1 hypothetical protein BAXH7_04042 [Bacillus amyloliquefaciens XH7]KYC98703.1 hypothetical protein B425_3166 [Bacillus amyloliquefaciens]QBG58386.1 hypothetical protein D2M30_4087 [Bacillus amyloliquefaciens]